MPWLVKSAWPKKLTGSATEVQHCLFIFFWGGVGDWKQFKIQKHNKLMIYMHGEFHARICC